jgi:hypothetical protein
MTTRPPAPDDLPPGNGQPGFTAGGGAPGQDPFEAQRARLASFWALVLRRFRDYTQRGTMAASRDPHEEGR